MKGLKNLFFLSLLLSACTFPRKYQKNKAFLYQNSIEISGGDFTKDQRISLKQKLFGQLDDSAKVTIKDFLFAFHFINHPPAYDSEYTTLSANSMKAAMIHQGYYSATVRYKADTILKGNQQRVYVKYKVEAKNPTLIDTLQFQIKKPDLQQLTIENSNESLIIKGQPISRVEILSEINRLVELYRNNGYYQFTSNDLKLRGDTSIAALTNISNDPFENLQLLAEANQKKDKPTIKLALILNPTADSIRFKKYYIDSITIYPDYTAADVTNPTEYKEDMKGGFLIRYHKKLVNNNVLLRNMRLHSGEVYSQENYNKTINNFSKSGVWQNTTIQIEPRKDTSGKINMIVQLLPAKKYGFEANVEASYSANSNTNSASIANAGNLLGLSTNVSLQNRNVGKSGTKMTHAIRAGIELNLNGQQGSNRKLNSNELSYTNTISLPRLLGPINLLFPNKKFISQQTFINVVPSYSNRIDLFNQLSFSSAFGNEFVTISHPNRKNLFKLINIEYSYLYNQSDSFKKTVAQNPYLRYSFNTALVMGLLNYSYSSTYINPKKLNHQRIFRWNIEESGLVFGRIGLFKKELRQFIKTDVEYTFIVDNQKSSTTFRAFAGVGIPIGESETSLPFFKQYFSGGANSMRGWPVRGIGPGAKPLAAYNSLSLNDRTGDVRLEMNGEYRYDIVPIIPNSLTLKGAFFVDAGNVWNFKNTRVGGGPDSLQFNFSRLYQQLGVTAGTGFRFDFNYFLIRFDLGFRFKRPDILKNDGWQIPNITLGRLLNKGEQVEISPGVYAYSNQLWRYENFNFTIGLSYPF